jgi:acyl-coenzyme A synthetase/AMP-(fatty) acid ligase
MNIVDPILYQCRSNPPRAALIAPGFPSGLVSYARLERSINNVCKKLWDLKLRSGDVVVFYINERVLHAVCILAAARMGVITGSGVNPALPKGIGLTAVITDLNFPYQAPRVILADSTWLLGDGKPAPSSHDMSQAKNGDICRIILTSGTTGTPKAVALTNGMLAKRIARHQFVFGNRLPYCMRTFVDMGFATSLGYQFLISTLWRGGTLIMPARNLQSAADAYNFYGIQNIITTPNGLAQLLEVHDGRKGLQPSLEMIMSGGSLLSPQLSELVRSRICSNLYTAYGATETSMVAGAPAYLLKGTPGAVGYVLPGIEVEIVNELDKPVPAGQEGVLRIRGLYNVAAYLGDPSESETSFRDGWFYPGDYGRFTRDKLLVISGRVKTVLNLGGDKLRPELVEDVISAHPHVQQNAVFSVNNELGIEELWAMIVARPGYDEPALRAHCNSHLPDRFVPVRFVAVEKLPLNAMGKIERQMLAEYCKTKLN